MENQFDVDTNREKMLTNTDNKFNEETLIRSVMSKNQKKHVLHWFRKGLRLHDNPALRQSLNGASTYHCVYILDPWFAGVSQVGINRWRLVFIYLIPYVGLKAAKPHLYFLSSATGYSVLSYVRAIYLTLVYLINTHLWWSGFTNGMYLGGEKGAHGEHDFERNLLSTWTSSLFSRKVWEITKTC